MTKAIQVGGITVGGGAPISIQSMTNTRTDDVKATLSQIRALAAAGCDIVRVAVPDMAAAKAVGKIKENCPLPLVCLLYTSTDKRCKDIDELTVSKEKELMAV